MKKVFSRSIGIAILVLMTISSGSSAFGEEGSLAGVISLSPAR
jgi:hypothetical protein